MQTAKHLSITGRVQGVGYRAWFTQQARQAGLAGWVRNRRDGSVEALVSGNDAAVTLLLSLCWEGPASSRVDTVEVTDTLVQTMDGFERRDTV